MKIESKSELIALHRCLFEVKFGKNPNDSDLLGHPDTAKLATQVIDELTEIDGDHWQQWRNADNHMDLISDMVVSLKAKFLKHIEEQDRADYIRNAIAPFLANESLIQTLVCDVFETNKRSAFIAH